MYDLGIENGKVYVDGIWKRVHLYIDAEKIVSISDDIQPARRKVDASGREVLPGLIDPHVHFELDLGTITSCDDFLTGSTAAAYGGMTTIIDFLDPVDHVGALEAAFDKRLKQAEKSIIDYAFHATIKNPKGDLEAFVLKMKDLGMHTLKLFTTYSDSGRRTDDDAIIELLKLSKKHDILIFAHIENDDMIVLNPSFTPQDLPISRPSISETTEALKLAEYTEQTGGAMYMVHLSSGETLESLVASYPDLINNGFYIESCPQYFTFDNNVLNQEDGYLYTFAPPLRSQHERSKLFRYKQHVYTIGTDHCAFMRQDKNKTLLQETPLGIPGVEHAFHVMRHHMGEEVIPRMTNRVADLNRLTGKGRIQVGYDADLMIYEPDSDATCQGGHGTCDYNLYEGHPAPGRVVSTIVRGHFVLDEGQLVGGKGKFVKGGTS